MRPHTTTIMLQSLRGGGGGRRQALSSLLGYAPGGYGGGGGYRRPLLQHQRQRGLCTPSSSSASPATSLARWLADSGDAARRRITWYACGPTVYDAAHLGHARYVAR